MSGRRTPPDRGLAPLTLVAMLDVLRRHRDEGISLTRLAAHLDISVHTARRLVEYLWTLGVPDADGFDNPAGMFDFDPYRFDDDIIQLTSDPVQPFSVRLDSVERYTVLLGLAQLRDLEPDPGRRASIDALAERLRPDHLRDDPASAHSRRPSSDSWLAPLSTAVRAGTQATLHYRAANGGGITTRTVDPLRLESRGRFTYLNAWCHERRALRWFRTDRIAALDPSNTPIGTYSAEERNRPLSVATSRMLPVTFNTTAAGLETLRPYFGSRTRPEPIAGHRSRVTVHLHSTDVACRLVCEHADDLEVVAPAEVRGLVAAFAAAALPDSTTNQ